MLLFRVYQKYLCLLQNLTPKLISSTYLKTSLDAGKWSVHCATPVSIWLSLLHSSNKKVSIFAIARPKLLFPHCVDRAHMVYVDLWVSNYFLPNNPFPQTKRREFLAALSQISDELHSLFPPLTFITTMPCLHGECGCFTTDTFSMHSLCKIHWNSFCIRNFV